MQVSRTAQYMALFRALESAKPRHQRLFCDPYAKRFLPRAFRALVAASRFRWFGRMLAWTIDRHWPGARSSGIARTRLIDDFTLAAVASGADQMVVLGAGFDCRALRLPELSKISVFELDRPPLLALKTNILRGVPGAKKPIRVGIDFLRDDLAKHLSQANYATDKQTLFLWEGVTNYLNAQAVDRTFVSLAELAPPASRVIFTYIDQAVFEGKSVVPGLDKIFAALRKSGEEWTFGFRPKDLGEYLANKGFRLLNDLGATEYRAEYMGAAASSLHGYEFYRIALAERTRSGVEDAPR